MDFSEAEHVEFGRSYLPNALKSKYPTVIINTIHSRRLNARDSNNNGRE